MRSTESQIYTCGIDDTLRRINLESKAYDGETLALGAQPRGMDIFPCNASRLVTATVKEIQLIENLRKISSIPAKFEPSSVSINTNNDIAIGGFDDNKVHIYTTEINSLVQKRELDHLGSITDCQYSPDGKLFVACDANRKVILYNVEEDYKLAHNQEWGFHNARVNSVAFSPDSLKVASGALDTNIIIWSVSAPNKHLIIKSKYFSHE